MNRLKMLWDRVRPTLQKFAWTVAVRVAVKVLRDLLRDFFDGL